MGLELDLSEEDLQRIADKKKDLLMPHARKNLGKDQDKDCPMISYESRGHGSRMGTWVCYLSKQLEGDLLHGGGSENTVYLRCNCNNYEHCETLLESIK